VKLIGYHAPSLWLGWRATMFTHNETSPSLDLMVPVFLIVALDCAPGAITAFFWVVVALFLRCRATVVRLIWISNAASHC